jgi:eukaryotic-like serine/threonine-protein kinase
MYGQVSEGQILAGKYRVERVLGQGGMGVVVAAHHLELDEKVAIKFLLPETLDNGEAVARFAREARAAVKIKSEHVARISDVGKLENGAPYMVMEYLDGGDLAAWLSQRGPLPIEQAVEFVLQACEAIAEAHALGIVHRDLKPANLFVVRRADGVLSVKVLDFGISKNVGAGSSGPDRSMTRTSALMGSPLYMSPEQMQSSKDVDARGDVWALGVILYELITGHPPFNGETMPELVLRIVTGEPTPLRSRRTDVPAALEGAIERCLVKARAQRFQTVGELALALLPFGPRRSRVSVDRIAGTLRSAGISGSGLELPLAAGGTVAMTNAGDAGTAASWGQTANKKTRAPWLALVLLGGACAAGGAFYFVRHNAAPVGAPSASPVSASAAEATPPLAVSAASAPLAGAVTSAPAAVQTASASAAPVEQSAVKTAEATAHSAAAHHGALSAKHAMTAAAALAPPVVAPAAPAAAAPKPAAASRDCDPPFTFDDQGRKNFKPECFR